MPVPVFPPALATRRPVSMNLSILGNSCKWNHAINSLYFTQIIRAYILSETKSSTEIVSPNVRMQI